MDQKRHLQFGFSQQHPEAILDAAGRARKARKILQILACERPDLADCRLLEIGCGAGLMTEHFARACRTVVAVDIDAEALRVARARHPAEHVLYALMDSQRHALAPETFDVVVCNHVYEHVPDAARLMDEIERLLAPQGICYFGAGNRLTWMEPHYRLPLLSVVPKWMAHPYLRWFRAQRHYYETHRTYWGLKALVARFHRVDYTLKVIAAPERFAAEDLLRPGSARQRLASFLARRFYWACPTFLWVLRR